MAPTAATQLSPVAATQLSPAERDRHVTHCVRQLMLSGGFKGQDIGGDYALSIIPVIQPHAFPRNKSVTRYTELAIESHNIQKGTNLKLKEILDTSVRMGGWPHYYVTFSAVDSSNNSVGIYETLVLRAISPEEGVYVIVFRAKPLV